MPVTDWRAWTAQQEVATPPVPFPGVGPILDIIKGTTSIPPTPSLAFPNDTNTPTTVNAVDPFGGWTVQKGTMRPSVPGLT